MARAGALAASLAAACLAAPGVRAAPPIDYRVVAAHPHDRRAYTQGLLWHAGRLYESTGRRGHSDLRVVDPPSGRVIARRALDPALFGEGLARVGERLLQLTWQSGRGLVYDLRSLEPIGAFRYPGEGWGLAFDGRRLWMSDGSDRLRVIEPDGFRERKRIAVRDEGRPVTRLNELEFADGSLFANVWRSERVARIDPDSGRVTGWLDLAGLLGPVDRGDVDVLNGLAWEPERRRLWVTGKLWPRIFVLELGAE